MLEGDKGQLKADQKQYDFITQSARVSAKANGHKYTAGPETLAEWIMLLVRTVRKSANL